MLSVILVAAIFVLVPVPGHAACTDPPRPGVDWRQCNFDRFDLRSVDLSGARLDNGSFNRAEMAGSNFSGLEGGRVRFLGADLREARFDGATLRFADFSQADLRGASFAGADLADARMVSADLRGADLTGARLRDADFFRANLEGATWIDGIHVCAEGSVSFCR